MKWIKYKQLVSRADNGVDVFQDMGLEYNIENEIYIQEIAYNDEYTIEDDDIEDIQEPTKEDKFEAQLTYTAMMTGTLLEEV